MNWVVVGAVWGFLAVALGAFGAHGLEKIAPGEEALGWWETATLYHLVHAPVLVLVGVLARARRGGSLAGWTLLGGSAVFSGTLYAMALGAPRWLGAITPLGGMGLLIGWLALVPMARRREG